MPHENSECGTGGITFLVKLRLPARSKRQADYLGGTAMFGLFAFFALVVAVIAVLGLPYRQSWYDRWGNYDR